MASDQSPTRNRLILIVAFASLFTLVALKFILDTYYTETMEAETQSRQADLAELQKLHKEESARLGSGSMPIAQAMKTLGQTGREAVPEMSQQASDDLQAMRGWTKLQDVKKSHVVEPPPASSGSSANVLDAGSDAKPMADAKEDAGGKQGGAHAH